MKITDSTYASVVSGVISIIVALIAVISSNNSIVAEIRTHNAVQDEKITSLTKAVEKHNSVLERTYKLEQDVAVIKSQIGRE